MVPLGVLVWGGAILGEHMKTSIFNMTFTLPPMVEMTQVEKDMPTPCRHSNLAFGVLPEL